MSAAFRTIERAVFELLAVERADAEATCGMSDREAAALMDRSRDAWAVIRSECERLEIHSAIAACDDTKRRNP